MRASLAFTLQPNRNLTVFLSFLLLLAFFVVWKITLFWIFKILLTIALMLYGIHAFKRHCRLSSPKSIRKIYWSAEEAWRLELGDHFEYHASLLENSIFASSLMILNFKLPSGKIRSCILWLSARNREDFRQLIRIGHRI